MFKNKDKYLIAVMALFLLRGFLNAFIPLMDKTEARYAEISRIMAETGNWITPQIDYGVPFWAKPPLSTWLSALSIKIFGLNEFAVRFPYLILSLVLVLIISKFARHKKTAFLVGFVLMTLPEFLLHAGVVSTDTALSLCVTMIFLSFWKAIQTESSKYWGYLMFVFIGLGLLAKGPIVLILTVPPIFIWVIYFNSYKTFFRQIPLFTGTLLTLAISAPWYYMAEMKTKGFLEYFLIGEHFKRFVDSSWTGDKYGFAKTQPFAIVWAFLFLFAFPWIQILAVRLWKSRKTMMKNKWVVFLLLWLVWTPFFFTFSSSLIHTYILPSIPPIALLIEYYWKDFKNKKTVLRLSMIFPILIIVALGFSLINNNLEFYAKTDKYLINQADLTSKKIYYLGQKSYSSQFYSQGEIKNISSKELKIKLKNNKKFYLLSESKHFKNIDTTKISKLKLIDSNKNSQIYSIGF